MSRYIEMQMTWTVAAQIIAAALENGTGEGREAARSELFRMAKILDNLRPEQLAGEPDIANVWEVIAEPKNGEQPPFGQTFFDEAQAARYARAMRRAGYSADLSPAFTAMPTSEAALKQAAIFYDDTRLMEREH